MTHALNLDRFANRWADFKGLQGNSRFSGINAFKVGAFNACSTALIAMIALSILTPFHPYCLIATCFLTPARFSLLRTVETDPHLQVRCKTRGQIFNFVIWKELLPEASIYLRLRLNPRWIPKQWKAKRA